MTTYAHISDEGRVDGIYDNLPTSWKNVSNFHLLGEDALKRYGFYVVEKRPIPTHNPDTTIVSAPVYVFTGDTVLEQYELSPRVAPPRNIEEEWKAVRSMRDRKIAEVEWRYTRAIREGRLGQKITDDLDKLDRYIQELADVPQKFSDPRDVVWPVYGE